MFPKNGHVTRTRLRAETLHFGVQARSRCFLKQEAGDTLSIISMIGMITLTALVVKNSILLVDTTNTFKPHP